MATLGSKGGAEKKPVAAAPPRMQASGSEAPSMLPVRETRPALESAFVRVIATSGVVGIGVALGAILVSQNVAGWIVGLVVSLVSVLVSAVLWSSRRM